MNLFLQLFVNLIVFLSFNLSAETADDFFNRPKPIYQEPDPIIGWIDSRKIQSLNGSWNYIIDPLKNGLPGESFFNDFPTNKIAQSDYELVEYNFLNAPLINVPGDWNSQHENLLFYQGAIWYYKKFEYTKNLDEITHLYIEGSNFLTKIFLNGNPVGEFKAGYTAFNFDITPELTNGTNHLMIFVDANLDRNSVPTYKTDWWLYGGLVGDVMLVSLPKAHIKNARIQLSKQNDKKINIDIYGSSDLAGKEINLSIPELNISKDFVMDADFRVKEEIQFTGEVWDIDNPKLYKVILATAFERLEDNIGFRNITTKGEIIYLNNKPIRLKGISSHAEPIGAQGFAFSAEHFDGILNEVVNLGGNFLRAAHYPYSRHLAKEADKAGILLWEEIPVYWNINWENENTYQIAYEQLSRMISRDWNRASVAVWSVGNETPYSESRMKFLTKLINEARKLDDTRLLSAALLGGSAEDFQNLLYAIAAVGIHSDIPSKDEKIVLQTFLSIFQGVDPASSSLSINLDDPIGKYLDIVALNEYFGWYYAVFLAPQIKISEKTFRLLMLELLPTIKFSNIFNKPIHLSEFGAGAKLNFVEGGIWSEEYQAKVYKAQISMIKNNMATIQGYSPWILKDFRSMMRPLAGIQDFYNRKGLIDENGNKKQAYDVLQEFYNE